MEKSYRVRMAGIGIFLLLTLAVGTWIEKEDELAQTGSWGLSFPNAGACPVGNATPGELAVLDAAFVGDTEDKTLYLTFDAGYENGHTEAILDALAKHNAPAAFFVVGPYIEQNPSLIQRMVQQGHTVGNHTWHHWDMEQISDRKTFSKELEDVEAAYENTIGSPMPKFYRPPRGIYSEKNLQMAKELAYKTVFWSLAYVDWKQDEQPSREEAFEKLLGRVHPGAVVLLHSTSATNAEILDELLTRWEEMGYRFAPIAELFDEPIQRIS